MSKLTRKLDIQRIRRENKITQKELARLTDYPQGFISKMESGKVSTPDAFIEKVKKALKIKNINDYVMFVGPEAEAEEETQDAQSTELTEKMMIERLFNLLEKREARIEKLERENDELRRENAELKR